jgi:hypothetical protein
MTNYIVNECLTNDEYIFTGVSHTVGQTIRFVFNEQSYCGTVGEVTSSPPSADFGQLYDDCCECLSGITESLNFNFIICGTELEINIEAFNFCREHGLPITGMTYELQLASYVPFCATFQGLSESGETNYHYSSGPFSLCENCGEEPPRSAGTEYEVCEICCDCGSTGSTINLITPPHPVYTDGYGTPVTQLNMVTLGGPNGLNS